MTWGVGEWGGSNPWGGIGPAAVVVPTLDGVTTPLGPHPVAGFLLDVLGGDVMTIVGSGFVEPMTIEVLSGGSGSYVVEGSGYIFDYRYDLTSSRMFVGSPALPQGLYHLRVANSAGEAVLEDVLAYEPFANEHTVERARVSFAVPWLSGPRMLRGL